MISFNTQIRVRYAETDKMGYVYYGNYATYYEVARVETLRHLGISYKELEDSGIMLPVVELNIHYKQPARYDDLLTVRTYIREKPAVRISFDYEVFNEEKVLLNTASTTLVFVNAQKGRACAIPQDLLKKMETYF